MPGFIDRINTLESIEFETYGCSRSRASLEAKYRKLDTREISRNVQEN